MEMVEDSGGGSADASYHELRAQDVYPKRDTIFDDPSIQCTPFTPLSGEYLKFVGKISDGVIALSNYRLYLKQRDATYLIPLGVIDALECREIFHLLISCKDAKSYKCTFDTNESCSEWQRRLAEAISRLQKLEDVFALAFYMWNSEEKTDLHSAFTSSSVVVGTTSDPERNLSHSQVFEIHFRDEVERLQFDLRGPWRISKANENFSLCPTYPRSLIVPGSISDRALEDVAKFRSSRRIPTIVWRHRGNGAVLARCSQPEVGWLGWRSPEDEDLVKALAEACAYDSPPRTNSSSSCSSSGHNNKNNSDTAMMNGDVSHHNGDRSAFDDDESEDSDGEKRDSLSAAAGEEATTPASDSQSICDLSAKAKSQKDIKSVLIVDARSYTTAVANRARGGGCECREYYTHCDIQFMDLPNIHAVRKSHHSLRQLVAASSDGSTWLSTLENTRWLAHLSALLKATVATVHAITHDARPVLVHCSDGWDRTPQITAISQLLMDPHYRTIDGFRVLVEREWIAFGHKFSDRCGVGLACEDTNERCPVFVQFLDCVHQLLRQFPTAFEFNQAYLIKLATHVYSNLFGTFLCNTSRERVERQVSERTYSVWALLQAARPRYTNYLYSQPPPSAAASSQAVLHPNYHIQELRLWTALYVPETSEASLEDVAAAAAAASALDDADDNPNSSSSGSGSAGTSGELTKTKSCDDLLSASDMPMLYPLQRRSSQPNIRESGPNMAMLNSALGSEALGPDDLPEGDKASITDQSETTESDEGKHSTSEQNGFADEETVNANPQEVLGDVKEEQKPVVEEQPHLNGVSDYDNDVEETSKVCEVKSADEDDVASNQGEEMPPHVIEDSVVESEGSELEVAEEATESTITCGVGEQGSVPDGAVVPNGVLRHRSRGLAEQSIEGSTDTLVAEAGIISGCSSDVGLASEESDFVNSKLSEMCADDLKLSNGVTVREEQEHRGGGSYQQQPSSAQVGERSRRSCSAEVESSERRVAPCGVCLQSMRVLDQSSLKESVKQQQNHFASSWNPVPGGDSSRGVNGAMSSRASAPFTPGHSRTPSSCLPSTPSEERGLNLSGGSNGVSTLDGLQNIKDQVTRRLFNIKKQHQSEVEDLRKELVELRQQLHAQLSHQHHNQLLDGVEDQMSLPESVGSYGSGGSAGVESGVSDTSWEAVEEVEGAGKPTLWVPDHAVDRCTTCHARFWIGYRKHHCRNCGKIFCGPCTETRAAIPREQLYHPVRVCGTCYSSLTSSAPSSATMCSTPAPTHNHSHHHHNHTLPPPTPAAPTALTCRHQQHQVTAALN